MAVDDKTSPPRVIEDAMLDPNDEARLDRMEASIHREFAWMRRTIIYSVVSFTVGVVSFALALARFLD